MKHLVDYEALIVFQLTLASTYEEVTYSRVTFFKLLSAFGGLMYTIRNVGNAFNRSPSTFAIENLLMRKLYSVNSSELGPSAKKRFEDTKIRSEGWFWQYLNERGSFYYNYKLCCLRWMGNSVCCCACLRCCCRRQDTVADRIFDKTKLRLGYEFDMINIIHQLRISNFMAQTNLKQYQMDMIRWF